MTALYVRAKVWWNRVLSRVAKAWADEQGATVAEYALILVLIAVALITVLKELGEALYARIEDVITKLPATP